MKTAYVVVQEREGENTDRESSWYTNINPCNVNCKLESRMQFNVLSILQCFINSRLVICNKRFYVLPQTAYWLAKLDAGVRKSATFTVAWHGPFTAKPLPLQSTHGISLPALRWRQWALGHLAGTLKAANNPRMCRMRQLDEDHLTPSCSQG
jgi:hypothetical protein